MKVGVDMVKCSRFNKMMENKTGLTKIFSNCEINKITAAVKPKERAAGYFAAKEALLKAVGIGLFKTIKLTEIQIAYEDTGRPYFVKTPSFVKLLADNGFHKADVSISHTATDAVATVVVE